MYEIGKALETCQRHPIRYEDILSQSRPRLHTYIQPTNQPANQSTNSQTQHNSHLPFPHCKNHPSPSTFLMQISVPWHLSIYSYQSVGRAKTAEVLSGFPTYMHSELLTYLPNLPLFPSTSRKRSTNPHFGNLISYHITTSHCVSICKIRGCRLSSIRMDGRIEFLPLLQVR